MADKFIHNIPQQETPLVTIGIPFYNASQYLESAIRSVINQTFSNWELLLVDDGSTDDSLTIAHSFDDHRIRVLNDGVNRGLVYRLNQIAQLAKGDFISRMDADDMMHAERIEKQISYIISNPHVDILGTGYVVINESDQILGLSKTIEFPAEGNAIFTGEFIAHPTVMARKKWFIDHPYNDRYFRAEDRELWIRVRNSTVFHNLKEPLHFYRVYDNDFKKYSATNKSVIKLFFGGIFTHRIPVLKALYYAFSFTAKSITYFILHLFKLTSLLKMERYGSVDEKTLSNLYEQFKKSNQ